MSNVKWVRASLNIWVLLDLNKTGKEKYIARKEKGTCIIFNKSIQTNGLNPI